MLEPFLGEIQIVAFNFPPRGWAFCEGQLLPINQNQALFSLLGTTYGGNGQTTFALPDLRGRVPIHAGGIYTLGSRGGSETVTLTANEVPAHTHTLKASNTTATTNEPSGNTLAKPAQAIYAAAANSTMSAAAINTLPSQSHENMQPTLALRYVIALQGIFPSQN
jgi:microcystin-dependent protein